MSATISGLKRNRVPTWFTWFCLALMPAQTASQADWLRFKDGGTVRAEATRDGDRLRIEAPGGPWVFPASAFLEISIEEHGEALDCRLDAEWHKATPERRWALFRLALGRNRRALYSRWLSAPTSGTTQDHPGLSRCRETFHAWTAPYAPADAAALRKRLGRSIREAATEHVLLLHQHDAEQEVVRERLELVEDVLLGFALHWSAEGIKLPPPRESLVSVYLRRREDYQAFLHRENAQAFLSTRGFYHPALRAVLAYDHRSRTEAAGPPSDSSQDRARRSLLAILEHRSIDLGLLAHETIHQLTIATGLAPSLQAHPLWLHEGLAMQFEAIEAHRWGGLDLLSPHRVDDWTPLAADARLAPLLRDEGLQSGYNRSAYARAWGFLHYLRCRHPASLSALLDHLRKPEAQPRDPAQFIRDHLGRTTTQIEFEWRTLGARLKSSAPPIRYQIQTDGDGHP